MKSEIIPISQDSKSDSLTIKITFEERFELNMFVELLDTPCAKAEFENLRNLITEQIKKQ